MYKFLVHILIGFASFCSAISFSYANDIWTLVHYEYHAPNWYCTYQLYGSTAYKTTIVEANSELYNNCPPTLPKR